MRSREQRPLRHERDPRCGGGVETRWTCQCRATEDDYRRSTAFPRAVRKGAVRTQKTGSYGMLMLESARLRNTFRIRILGPHGNIRARVASTDCKRCGLVGGVAAQVGRKYDVARVAA